MFSPFSIAQNRFLRLLVVTVLLLPGGCDLNLGGPQSAAVKYVRALVEQPADSLELAKAHTHLPNRVILEYARGLYDQGIKLKYRAEMRESPDDSEAQVAVAIVPKRAEFFNEREHTLIVDLRREKKQGWLVTDVKAMP